MTDQFLIALEATGNNPAAWSVVETLLSTTDSSVGIEALAWTHEDYSRYEDVASGHTAGLGFPIATWTLRAPSMLQRENLRDFCSGPSASVYIRTPSNETTAGVRVWKDYLCIAHWVQRPELVDFAYVEQVEITFTHCEDVTA